MAPGGVAGAEIAAERPCLGRRFDDDDVHGACSPMHAAPHLRCAPGVPGAIHYRFENRK